jgi:hypothetical protein
MNFHFFTDIDHGDLLEVLWKFRPLPSPDVQILVMLIVLLCLHLIFTPLRTHYVHLSGILDCWYCRA